MKKRSVAKALAILTVGTEVLGVLCACKATATVSSIANAFPNLTKMEIAKLALRECIPSVALIIASARFIDGFFLLSNGFDTEC